MIQAGWTRWLQSPPVSGWLALLCATVALAIPTLVRASVSGVVTGCEFTPYLPFVAVCAILLRWWQAGAVALASVVILGGLVGGSSAYRMDCFMPAAGIFLAAAAMMIGVALFVRRVISTIRTRLTEDPSGGIVFSLEKGEVWASWYGDGRPIRLGSERKVSEMMEDFLAQSEIGKRLTRK